MRFCFVILHYMTLNDTIECVNSIRSIRHEQDYKIVVVDNGSPEDDIAKLKENFEELSCVHFIKLPTNLGFANGNNAGFLFAKEKLDPDFIILLNNDTVLNQSNFLDEIDLIYKNEKFDVLGPNIISLVDFKQQNPVAKEGLNGYKLIDTYKKIKKLRLLNLLFLDGMVFKLKRKLQSMKKKRYIDTEISNMNQIKNVKLQGSCLIA